MHVSIHQHRVEKGKWGRMRILSNSKNIGIYRRLFARGIESVTRRISISPVLYPVPPGLYLIPIFPTPRACPVEHRLTTRIQPLVCHRQVACVDTPPVGRQAVERKLGGVRGPLSSVDPSCWFPEATRERSPATFYSALHTEDEVTVSKTRWLA